MPDFTSIDANQMHSFKMFISKTHPSSLFEVLHQIATVAHSDNTDDINKMCFISGIYNSINCTYIYLLCYNSLFHILVTSG